MSVYRSTFASEPVNSEKQLLGRRLEQEQDTSSRHYRMRAIDYLAVGLLLTYVWRIQDLFPVLATMRLPVVVSLVALGLWVLNGHATRALSSYRHPVIKAATFILVWMVLSIPGSVYAGLSFSFVVNDHAKTFLMMLILVSSIRGLHDVERLIVANVAGATVYCIKILTTFSVEPGGRLGDLFFYDSNDLAMLIVGTLPLAIHLLVVKRSSDVYRKILFGLCAAIFLLTVVKTGSRGGFIGLLAIGIYLSLFFQAVKPKIRFGAVAAGVMVLMAVAGPAYWTQMGTILDPTQDYNWSGNNDVGRMAIWKRGMGYMAESPLFGVGASAFPVAEGTMSDLASRQNFGVGLKWSAAHNSFVQIGAELGLPGLVAFAFLIWKMIDTCRAMGKSRWARSTWGDKGSLSQALTGSVIGYTVAGFFLSQAYSAFLYATIALVVGMATTTGRGRGAARHRLRGRRRRRGLGAPHASLKV